jgi:hypothetical protein
VLVFAERTGDVDNILESLITSGVEAVAVHGGLDQQDREYAISSFKVRNPPLWQVSRQVIHGPHPSPLPPADSAAHRRSHRPLTQSTTCRDLLFGVTVAVETAKDCALTGI